MITPRGYANKYDVAVGNSAAREGEQRGVSLSTGLNGWLADIHGSKKTPAELALQYRLPEEYIRSVLAHPPVAEADDDASDE